MIAEKWFEAWVFLNHRNLWTRYLKSFRKFKLLNFLRWWSIFWGVIEMHSVKHGILNDSRFARLALHHFWYQSWNALLKMFVFWMRIGKLCWELKCFIWMCFNLICKLHNCSEQDGRSEWRKISCRILKVRWFSDFKFMIEVYGCRQDDGSEPDIQLKAG